MVTLKRLISTLSIVTILVLSGVAIGLYEAFTNPIFAVGTSTSISATSASFSGTSAFENITSSTGAFKGLPDFVNYKVGSYTIGKNGTTNTIIYNSSNSATVINSELSVINTKGGGWIHTKGGTYTITTALTIPDNGHLKFTGDGAELTVFQIPAGSDNNLFEFTGVKAANSFFNYFADFEAIGNSGAGGATNTAFLLSATVNGITDSIWFNIFFRDFKQDSVYITTANAWNNQFINNVFEYAGRSAIYQVGGSDMRVVNNKFLYNRGSYAVVIQGTYNHITNNWLYLNDKTAMYLGAGAASNVISDNVFQSNGKVTSNTWDDIYVDNGVSNVISNNDMSGSTQVNKTKYGIHIDTPSINNLIEGNNFKPTLSSSFGTAAILTFAGNDIHGNWGYNPVGASSITVTASIFNYTAGSSPETIYIINGTISKIVSGGRTIATAAGATGVPITVELSPGGTLNVTYSVAPVMEKYIH